ncbi:MAG: alpha-1,6-mannosyltransferase [Bathelium mastoideum]|nr:MAG: alpha-1,6-mannosyltransferase [Bathelium mastoideum]
MDRSNAATSLVNTPPTPPQLPILQLSSSTLCEDSGFESPAPKRRRLNNEGPEHESTCSIDQLSLSPPDCQDWECDGVGDWFSNAELPIDESSFLEHTILNGNKSAPLLSGEDLDEAFVEQVWQDRPVEIYYDIDHDDWKRANEPVCFGMLEDLPVAVRETRKASLEGGVVPALVCCDRVLHESDSSEIGVLGPDIAKAIRVLSEDPDIDLQIRCTIKFDQSPSRARRKLKTTLTCWARLSIIVYGVLSNFDCVGDYIEDCGLYLQDPDGCNRNVPYRNPHRLSGMDKYPPMTIEQDLKNASIQQKAYTVADDVAGLLESQQDLPETATPSSVITPLKSHQRKALTFMLEREKGWNFHGAQPDVWKDASRGCYLNTISKEKQAGRPPAFQGGILADYMGLGKSLSMISLIVSDLLPGQTPPSMPASYKPKDPVSSHLRCTLLVVPPNLLHTWKVQLNRHLTPDSIRFRTHHGRDKVRHRSELTGLDLLITTYQTIAAEYQRQNTSLSILFALKWHRVILDEAHYIRDRTTVTAKAVCGLESSRRWAITGTPLQNHVMDVASLFQFIRAYPYSDPRVFDQDIVRKIGTSEQSVGIERLKKLFSCVALRRSNNAIDLPPRTDLVHPVTFNQQESELYEAIRTQAICVLEDAKNADDMTHQTYQNALRYITALRMICNLGIAAPLPATQGVQKCSISEKVIWNVVAATEAYEGLLAAGQACCQHCKTAIDSVEESESINTPSPPLISQCLRILCGNCSRSANVSMQRESWCGHQLRCKSAPVDPNLRMKTCPEPSSSTRPDTLSSSSSKIACLAKALQSTGSEKSVVFSTWTSTLDAIEQVLREARIKFVRYDGAVSPTNRIAALDAFRNDSTVSVMLITTACGAVGLDLTAASRAYLMEPHWNPTVEEQALARIHRMGQTREVTTIRFVMEDSYEQHVVNVKGAKTRMAERLFPENRAGFTPDLIQDLQSVIEANGST